MQTSTLLMRAVFHSVREDIHSQFVDGDAAGVVANALDNVDWEYFDGLDDEELCGHAGHDTDHEAMATCRICGGNAE